MREIGRKFIEDENTYKYSSLCDIMDALSGGKFWDSFNPKNDNDINSLPIGHGTGIDFFTSVTNRKMEIFADYLAMNYVSPESVLVLKKDFPQLVEVLDKMIDKIVLKIKEL